MITLKKTTIELPVVEISENEYFELWNLSKEKRKEKYKICHWNTDDGNNCILFEGESFYREILLLKN